MKTRLLLSLAACLLMANTLAADDDTKEPAAAAEEKTLLEQVKESPDDATLLRTYLITELRAISGMLGSDVDAAEKRLEAFEAALEDHEPEAASAKSLLRQGRSAIASFKKQIELIRTPLEELQAKVKENPADSAALSQYFAKVSIETGSLMDSDPDKASEQLAAATKFLKELNDANEDENAARLLQTMLARLGSIERRIATAKRQQEVIGLDAAPLKVDAWVNGEPLDEGDLKGKVVLLDFWAVWCGPCIATFPHLREWQETYADKGLVIVGLTRYYNYAWDEEKNGPARPQGEEKVEPEAEQEMLSKFAEEHDLKHRFAIQTGNELSEFYGVSGIPHVVVIDREGKVRMIKVGSGPDNAKAIGDLLAELIN